MINIIPNWHPVLVHFTIGLLTTSVVFYVLSVFSPVGETLKNNWRIFARWCLWIGMGITLATLVAGYLAYNSVDHDTPSHEAMTEHRNWAFATAAGFAILTLWSVWNRIKQQLPGLFFVIFALINGALLASTGWHGGEAVYRYGLGVMSLPQKNVNGEGHAHAAGSEQHTSSEMKSEQPSGLKSQHNKDENDKNSHGSHAH